MPDHIHAFVSPAEEIALERWVAFFKSLVSREWPEPRDQPIWQRSFWDRQLRSTESYGEKWLYVQENPVRHGLVEASENWPFQGTMNRLSW